MEHLKTLTVKHEAQPISESLSYRPLSDQNALKSEVNVIKITSYTWKFYNRFFKIIDESKKNSFIFKMKRK